MNLSILVVTIDKISMCIVYESLKIYNIFFPIPFFFYIYSKAYTGKRKKKIDSTMDAMQLEESYAVSKIT